MRTRAEGKFPDPCRRIKGPAPTRWSRRQFGRREAIAQVSEYWVDIINVQRTKMRRAESAGFVVEQFDEGLVALLDFLAAPARSDLIEPLAIQIIRPGVVVIWMVEIGMGLRMVDQLEA